MNGFLIAASSSGAGKTTVTLGLLRVMRRHGLAHVSAKAGPDYIDPAFLAAASGQPCGNLDPWAMRPSLLRAEARRVSAQDRLLVVEGMMGLFDGSIGQGGSAADLAAMLGLPVVLVVDCAGLSHSVAAIAQGFARHREDITLAGVVFNRVGSERHLAMLQSAMDAISIPVFGHLMRQPDLVLPSRHLGLVQAAEHGELEQFIDRAADAVGEGVDWKKLAKLECSIGPAEDPAETMLPLGSRIAIAHDPAFSFAYRHCLDGWRRQGAELTFFSPLADEAPGTDCDAVFLPGGYPELHAGRLAGAAGYKSGMKQAAARGAFIYGECGGYMMLGDGLIDAAGERHAMLGLLPLVTSFQTPKRHLGYRRMRAAAGRPWKNWLRGHEFHYASVIEEGEADPLFDVRDAAANDLGQTGLRRGNVCGSFLHVVDCEER